MHGLASVDDPMPGLDPEFAVVLLPVNRVPTLAIDLEPGSRRLAGQRALRPRTHAECQ